MYVGLYLGLTTLLGTFVLELTNIEVVKQLVRHKSMNIYIASSSVH